MGFLLKKKGKKNAPENGQSAYKKTLGLGKIATTSRQGIIYGHFENLIYIKKIKFFKKMI